MNDPKIKQQIVEKIKNASNILVTVSKDPSVDELSAALGLTLLLNKMDKHATAIFSGQLPPAITFLDPDKTFEDTTNSLRDFIIALDKEKADHLRYKVENDLVKIYITPYRTTITSDDLEFSQGDYNVELVIALGVENKDHLDAALDGHGKILHDATVVTLTAGSQTSNLGSLDWHDSNASSLGEMLTTLHDAIRPEKSLLDQPIATAFLTSIVAATERFSNPRTSSRVMTIAAQLMAAGADQQLIAARLDEAQEEDNHDSAPDASGAADTSDEEVVLSEGESTKLKKDDAEPAEKKPNGELVISHEKKGTLDEVTEQTNRERLEESARVAERALEKHEEAKQFDQLPQVLQPPAQPAAAPRGAIDFVPSSPPTTAAEPMLGGTLNATSEQAENDKRREIESDKNKVILSHNVLGNTSPAQASPINTAVASKEEEAPVDIFRAADPTAQPSSIEPPSLPTAVAPPVVPPSEQPSDTVTLPPPAPLPTLADIDANNRVATTPDDARAAIDAAFAASNGPAAPAVPPVAPAPAAPDLSGIGLPLPPPLPETFSVNASLPPLTGPERLGDILSEPAAPAAPPPTSLPNTPPADPGQFRIPGQN